MYNNYGATLSLVIRVVFIRRDGKNSFSYWENHRILRAGYSRALYSIIIICTLATAGMRSSAQVLIFVDMQKALES